MQQKAFTLHNRGMNRDLSISKAGESSAYENHNIRIIARDNDTLLSVTNERGNKEVVLPDILGELVGWNVLNNHIILFTNEGYVDRIYRVDYDSSEGIFNIVYGYKNQVSGLPLYEGNLGFSLEHPIESIVYFEADNIQKIYWVDGIHPLRFMNFMAESDEVATWTDPNDNTYFDSNRPIEFTASATIEKDNSGNNRANGTIQYLLTYFNEHGQETGIAWVSDLVYLSPTNVGGSADGFNSNKITLTFKDLDSRFTNFRVYSVFRSSLNGTTVSYLVGEGKTGDNAIIVDDGAHITAIDSSRLLYLGSQNLIAGTMTHKDQTLFLGDLESTGSDYSAIENAVKSMYDEYGISNCVNFMYSDDDVDDIGNIKYSDIDGTYSYTSQLSATSSDILSFKGGEKYRFALSFRTKAGVQTKAFWIGDKVNDLYPIIDVNNNIIKRVVAYCNIPSSVLSSIDADLSTVQLMIAEATYADRSVKAQGIVNPTMFNVWERYNSRLYSMPSWITRPRGSNLTFTHMCPVENSTSSSGEIQCNYWTGSQDPTPYYFVEDGKIVGDLDGLASYDFVMVAYCYEIKNNHRGDEKDECYYACVILKGLGTAPSRDITAAESKAIFDANPNTPTEIASLGVTSVKSYTFYGNYKQAYAKLNEFLKENGVTESEMLPSDTALRSWFSERNKNTRWRIQGNSSEWESSFLTAANAHTSWHIVTEEALSSANSYTAALYKRHLMFVDENVVTLNSPEFDYEAVYCDNQYNDNNAYKFRLVGIAKITGSYSDYIVDASHGKASGENLVSASFNATEDGGNLDSLTAWPLWKEIGLQPKDDDDIEEDVTKRTPKDYEYAADINKYWLYLWNHFGKIDAYTDEEGNDYSNLHSKTFATMRFSNCTMYKNLGGITNIFQPESVRMFTAVNSQYTGIEVIGETKYYDGCPSISLGLPGEHKYPILFSNGSQDTKDVISSDADTAHLFINDPVQINFLSNPHAIISLPTLNESDGYWECVLPYINTGGPNTGFAPNYAEGILPWKDNIVHHVRQLPFTPSFNDPDLSLGEFDRYLFIGELYYDFDAQGVEDTRYGGISESAIEACRFIPAGPSYNVADLKRRNISIRANQGDTYIQRWDCVKTKPVGASAANNVIDVTSVMIETHINLDGRTDKLRGTRYLASIDTEKYGVINPVYSQQNNYFMQRVLDDDTNLDTYRSSITWTLDKQDSADIDEWTHITLANNLKLDGDKGYCRALRRFNNTILAFQDRAISEILFNSRTQLSTAEGVPVEIANSGKVDGKRYISNKYGCTNKWSIVEGKAALYFVDNINKAFCSFGGQGIQSLSSRLGFDVWFRRSNKIEPWSPDKFDNIVSFYDRIHSDVYLVTERSEDNMPCLVYNEMLGMFTSFFDYAKVPMMTNVDDKFISFKNHKLWLQNEGLFCNFFGSQYDFWVNYRVTPDPFGDKIWTNIDYRADFYNVLDNVPESMMINGEFYDDMPGTYQDFETFTNVRVWNEYQNTGEVFLKREYSTEDTTRRKFRIWHVAIPRSVKTNRNKWGLDRIRNPWINVLFKKELGPDNNMNLMQLHDVTVRYYE